MALKIILSDNYMQHALGMESGFRTGLLTRHCVNLVGGQNLQTLHEYYTEVSDANRDKARQVLDELMGE